MLAFLRSLHERVKRVLFFVFLELFTCLSIIVSRRLDASRDLAITNVTVFLENIQAYKIGYILELFSHD